MGILTRRGEEDRVVLMDKIVSWNIRGLNWPNKQEDLKSFLQTNKVGMIELIETKIKTKNDSYIVARAFPGWR